ncbi:neurocan core protein-like [Branchiostoma floridae x Branchiostoma japonicum]
MPCQHGHCVDQDGGYNCACSPGWTGQNCQQDVNECSGNPCRFGDCQNKDGGYKCTCKQGWTGQDCQQARQCQDGWHKYNNHCYKRMSDRVGWSTASSRCKQQGAILASIKDRGENNFILDLFLNGG